MLSTSNENYNFGPWGMVWRSNYGWWNRSVIQQTQVNLSWPSKNCRTVKILKGLVPVTILAEQKPMVVTDKLLTSKGKKFQVGATSFTIDDVSTLAGKQHQIKMTVSEENRDGSEDWSRMQTLQQRLEVQDDKGNKQQFYFNNLGWGGGPSTAQVWFTVQPGTGKLGPPTKLIYYQWILMEHEVEFEFKGLPLP
jgi:hypothetical protein